MAQIGYPACSVLTLSELAQVTLSSFLYLTYSTCISLFIQSFLWSRGCQVSATRRHDSDNHPDRRLSTTTRRRLSTECWLQSIITPTSTAQALYSEHNNWQSHSFIPTYSLTQSLLPFFSRPDRPPLLSFSRFFFATSLVLLRHVATRHSTIYRSDIRTLSIRLVQPCWINLFRTRGLIDSGTTLPYSALTCPLIFFQLFGLIILQNRANYLQTT